MSLPRDAMLLRIFFSEDERYEGRPLHEAIVKTGRAAAVAGATVSRGPVGFGRSSRLHTTKILRLSEDLPLYIDIVDDEEAFKACLPTLDPMMGSGLVTLEKVQMLEYDADVKHAPR